MTRVKRFWIPVAITFGGLLICNYIKTNLIQANYPLIKDGYVNIYMHNNIVSTIFYAIMMMVMKPVAEELFFRKALIKFGSKKRVLALTIISLLLCAITRAHGLLGIAEWVLMALPVTIAYLVTRNIYVSVMAHVAFEFYDNIYSVVYAIARILNR
jgi:hypothetical protein